MVISFITPTAYIDKYANQGDFHLVLSHLLNRSESNVYEKIMINSDKKLVLDNGLFENHFPEGIDSLINKAIKIKADSFFAPDHLYNRSRTEEAFEMTCYCLKKRNLQNKIKINIVIQADNTKDYIESYKKFAKDDRVNLIGLSILSIPRCFGNQKVDKKNSYIHDDNEIVDSRIKCLKELNKLDIHKNSHLLGAGSSYLDVKYANENCPFVISNDSSCCFQSGLFGKRLTKELKVPNGKIKEKVNFELKSITKKQEEDIQYNINQIKKILCHK